MQLLVLTVGIALLFVQLFFVSLVIGGYTEAIWGVYSVPAVICVLAVIFYIYQHKVRVRLNREKQEIFAQFKALGFKSTQQYKVSGQLFAIDENSRRWFVMRYADPKSTRIHRFEDIRGYERRENAQTQTVGTGLAATSWMGLATFTSQKVYTKLGVVVFLNDIKHPTEFISCMGNEDGVDEVLNILDIICDR